MQPFRPRHILATFRSNAGLPGTFFRDRRGVGAVEFALIAPVLLIAYLGAFEISIGFTVARKVSQASSSVADILTQKEQVSKSDLNGMKYVVSSIMTPFAVSNFTLKMTGILVTAENKGVVQWSGDGAGGRPYTAGTTIVIPAPASMIGSYLVRSELTVPHTISFFPVSGAGSIDITKKFFFRQRVGKTLLCKDCT